MLFAQQLGPNSVLVCEDLRVDQLLAGVRCLYDFSILRALAFFLVGLADKKPYASDGAIDPNEFAASKCKTR